MENRQPDYPMMDINFDTWSADCETYLDNADINNIQTFEKFFKNHEFTDTQGYVFVAKAYEKTSFWKQVNPFAAKGMIVFEYTGRKITIDELKSSYTEHRESNSFLKEFEGMDKHILASKSFRELLIG